MALLGGESWEIYLIDQIFDYWQLNGGTAGLTTDIVAGVGRCGGPAYFNSTIGQGPTKGIDFGTPYQGYAGWAHQPINFNGLERFYLHTPGGGIGYHLSIQIPADGSVVVWQGGPSVINSNVIGSLPAGTILQDQWFHFGFEWLVDLSAGWIRLWIDGFLRLEVTGIRTVTPIYPTFIPSIEPVSGLFWAPLGYLGDMYWGDATGPAPWNSFLGDLRVEGQTNLTDADSAGGGTYKEWTPSAGTDHGALTDEIPPDDGTTYVEGDTPGERETFKFPPITLGFGTVFGVQLMPSLAKINPGLRAIAPLVYSGGTLDTGASEGLNVATYRYYPAMYQVNPVSAANWTAATVDAAELGVAITV